MNVPYPFSSKNLLAIGVTIFLLWILAVGYYVPHFSKPLNWLLAWFFVGLISCHIVVGNKIFRIHQTFPVQKFLLYVAGFSMIRWLYVYFVLQHHLPPSTIFHYSGRVLWFLIPSSSMLILLGYGIAQYWHIHHKASFIVPDKNQVSSDIPSEITSILRFRSEGKEVQLSLPSLLYVQANGEYMLYQCINQRYLRFQRLKEAEVELAPFGFVRIHRSYIISKAAVRTYSRTEVELINGTVLPISRTYRKVLG